jgi:predicted nuclease with RNAse H fold
MTRPGPVWVGADPGGKGKFGIALAVDGSQPLTESVDCAEDAVKFFFAHFDIMPSGVGVDAPLWWSSGKHGLRRADKWIRDTYNLPSKNVQAINSMWGSVLVQGALFVELLRLSFPTVNVTETHPKAVLRATGEETWKGIFRELHTPLTIDGKPDDQRDALISAISAREGFCGRWTRDLIQERCTSEQDPLKHWLAPVHYFWPEG